MKIDIFQTEKKYGIIYADPPWLYARQFVKGAACDHYGLMRLDEIAALPLSALADENCALFLWVTFPLLEDCIKIFKAWEFRYVRLGLVGLRQIEKMGIPFLELVTIQKVIVKYAS